MEMDSVNSKTLPARSEVDQKYKWKLEDIYSSDDMWENDFKEIKKLLPEISGFKEKLKESPVTFLECLKLG